METKPRHDGGIHIYTQEGSKNDPKNYRGITVTPTRRKIYSKLQSTLTEEYIKHKQAEEQSGFRTGRSTIDLYTLKIVLEKHTR